MRRTRAARALAAVALLGISGCGTAPTAAVSPAGGWHGDEPVSPPPRPDFTLTDTSGEPYDFREQTGGLPTLLFFGYTSCPDECYTAMADVTAALRRTPEDLRERTRVVFVSTDPDRDDGPRLRRWLDQYSPDYVGLTGTAEQVREVQQLTGASVAARSGPQPTLPGRPDEHTHAPGTAPHRHDGPLGYGVDHATSIFAFDASDRMPVRYPPSANAADIAADLPALAEKENS